MNGFSKSLALIPSVVIKSELMVEDFRQSQTLDL